MRTKRFAFGQWLDDAGAMTVAQLEEIIQRGQSQQRAIAEYPLPQIFDLFDRVRALWRNPDSAYRQEAQRTLPALTGFSPEMIKLGLDEIDALLNPEILQKKIDTELRGIPRGVGFHYREATKSSLKWYPIGTVYHVLSGNVFLVGPSSLVEGLLTGNVNILKMPSEETFFLPLFIQSILECDHDGVVSASIVALEFSSKQKEIIDFFKQSVDGIVVWGGEVAVQAYRSGLPSKTRLIIFGPKLSFAFISTKGLARQKIENVADLVAQELAIWDQNACTAPQVCFVEGLENAHLLLEAMPGAMEKAARTVPSGSADANAAVDIRQLRSLFEVAESRSLGAVRHSGENVNWTIILDKEVTLEASPLNRTLRLIPVDTTDQVFDGISPFKNYLQTVGLLVDAEEHVELAQKLAYAGALKITVLGEMGGGEVDDPHDGAYDLPQFLNLVVTKWRAPSEDLAPFDVAPENQRQALKEARFQSMIRAARKSEFYQRKFSGKKLGALADLAQIDPLTRAEWEANMAPRTQTLATRVATGGYVTRSGGSTGDPKFSFFDNADWTAMCENAVTSFRACGLKAGDRIANLMLAGDLYGSFISFNHVDYMLGTTSFAFAGEYTAEGFLEVWRSFKLNAIQGLPSVFMVLLRKCKQLEPDFCLEKVMYAGLPMSREDRRWLQEELGVKRVASIIGTTEAGQLAYQCASLSGTHHHVADDYNYVEILDDEGAAVKPGVRGRIAVTTLMKTNYPLIRYLIGDAAQWTGQLCPCGRKSPVLEYLGRWDDILSIGLSNLRYSELRQALEHLPLSELQLGASFGGDRELLTVAVESTDSGVALKGKIRAALFGRFPILAQQVDQNILAIEIKLAAPGTLKRNARSGKVMAIVDERSKATPSS